MKAEEVARYLRDNPQFFEDYAEMMSQVVIPHPHGGRAISITERQIVALREKAKQLESRLAEMIRFGEENDGIADKVHRLALALLAADGGGAVLQTLYRHLVEDFAVPHVALRLWGVPAGQGGSEFQEVTEALHQQAAQLAQPYCGPAHDAAVNAWFGDAAAHLRSHALVPLRQGERSIGLLALASEEAERFYPEMGTLYLSRIGELASAALVRGLD